MAKTAEASMNVSALKLADQYVQEIIDNAAHVVLYNFNSETYEWEKTNVEGALFLYSRSVEPKYNLFILNRLNTMNLMEPITEGLDLQLEDPFLLYRSSKGKINGVWFYVRDECVRIAQTVEKLVKEVSNDQSKLNMALHSCSCNPLQSSESNFKSPNKNKHTKVDESSRKVMDFFAKARDKIPFHPPGGFVVPGSGIQFKSVKQESDVQRSEVNPILKKLMSNPLKTVEQIEREHKAVALMEVPSTQRKSQKKEKSQPRTPRPLSLNVNSQGSISQNDLENGFSYLHLPESPPEGFNPTGPLQTQKFYNSNLKGSPSSEPLEVSVLERSVKSITNQLPASSKTPTKPALIPPVMFTGAACEEASLEVIKAEPISIDVQPEPLTKSQLLQAVSYLLKNDADFVNKLHEAYVKSFVDLVS